MIEYKDWLKKVESEHEGLVQLIIDDIAERYAPGDFAYQNNFFSIIFRACYGAHCFIQNVDDLKQKRGLDRRFVRDAKKAIDSIEQIITFLKKHKLKGTPHLYGSMLHFALTMQKDEILFNHKNGTADVCELLISTLSALNGSLTNDGQFRFRELHRLKHGCFLYPHPIDNDSAAKPHRMLAVYLVALIRLYSSGQSLRHPGIPMPKTGKPHHEIVDMLVKMVFPEVRISSKSAEADFKKNTPGIRLVPWKNPLKK